jgi:hypothetical protein
MMPDWYALFQLAGPHFEIELNHLHPVVKSGLKIWALVEIAFGVGEGRGLDTDHHADATAIAIAKRTSEPDLQQWLTKVLVQRGLQGCRLGVCRRAEEAHDCK